MLFKYIYNYFSWASEKLFDFIKISRKQNLITENLVKYLFIFLKYIKLAKELIKFIVLIIISNILLDYYPLDTYNKLRLSPLRFIDSNLLSSI
jgi:hypothetical protein